MQSINDNLQIENMNYLNSLNSEKKNHSIVKEKLNKLETELLHNNLFFEKNNSEIKKLEMIISNQEKDIIELVVENMKLKIELENKNRINLDELKSVDVSQIIVYITKLGL